MPWATGRRAIADDVLNREDMTMTSDESKKDDGMTSGIGVLERELLQQGLRALPDTPPPRDVWRRITEQARAEGLLHERSRWGGARWLAGAGLAAAVALSVLQLPWFDAQPFDEGPFPTEPAVMESADTRSLDALMVQSQWLERHLRALPAERGVMRASTAATISELQDRIAAIDYTLNDPGTDLTVEQQERFWRERVRLMDSLMQVRYAHAQRTSF